MKKTIISLIIVAVVAIGGYMLITKKHVDTTVASDTATVAGENQAPSGKKIPFADFVKKGGSYECSVEQHVGNIDSNGHVFIDGQRVRGEFTSNVSGKTIDSSLIIKDSMAYTWSSMMPVGMKMAVNTTTGDHDANASGSYDFNAMNIGDYNCKEWKVDEATFALPAGINFHDVPTAPKQ